MNDEDRVTRSSGDREELRRAAETDDDDIEHLRKVPGRLNRGRRGATVNSDSNGGGWKPRPIEHLTCPSGQEVQVRRPGPEFMLRSGRVARTFTRAMGDKVKAAAGPEDFVDTLSGDELAAVVSFARELVCAMLVAPRLVVNPTKEGDVGPDDIGDDFWFLFNYGMTGYFNLSVPVGDGEVKVENLETFREEPSVPGDSVDGQDVRPDTQLSA